MSWIFNKTNTLENKKFDGNLREFYMNGVSGLVRENIQNSMDARVSDSTPVIIKIKIENHNKYDIPGFYELSDRILCLEGGNQSTEEKIKVMKENLALSEYKYLSFEDLNTKGLSGAIEPYKDKVTQTYHAYAYSTGEHYKESDDEKEKVRGGSHGVGKIASNSASIYNLMYFMNCDENGYKTIGGTVHFIDHSYKGENYRATGYFAQLSDNQFIAEENKCLYHPIFDKNDRGLKIVIPFLNKGFDSENEIVRTVIDGFLIALLNERLIVHVNDIKISKHEIDSLINDTRYFEKDKYEDKDLFTKLYLDTIREDGSRIDIAYNEVNLQFKLYLRFDNNIKHGRLGIFRSIGMKIEDRRIHNYGSKQFNAVLIPSDGDGDYRLKTLENDSHTKIDYKQIHDPKSKESARRFLAELSDKIRQLIDDRMSELYPDEGVINTADVLYEFDAKFQHDFAKKHTTVSIGTGDKRKTIIKVDSTNLPGDTPGQGNRKRGKGIFPYKRVQKTFGSKGSKMYYSIPSSNVKRIQTQVKEHLIINIPNLVGNVKVNKFNLLLSVVDGMGEEYINQLDLRDSYCNGIDQNQNSKVKISKYAIENILVKAEKIHIDLDLNNTKDKYNKLNYYLEVVANDF